MRHLIKCSAEDIGRLARSKDTIVRIIISSFLHIGDTVDAPSTDAIAKYFRARKNGSLL